MPYSEENKFKAKKYLGQNFLVSKKHLKKIAQEILENTNKITEIIEVGPGFGALTEELLLGIRHKNMTIKVIGVEKDNRLYSYLKNKFNRFANFKLENDDILKFLDEQANKFKQYKLVGNIPYYLTKPLINKGLSLKTPPQEIIFLIQKEVAVKLINPKKNNIFSLAVNLRSIIKRLCVIKKGNFRPMPKVDSTLIKISHIQQIPHFESIMQLIKQGFASKRKTLYNNLVKYYPKMLIENSLRRLQLKTAVRAENLEPKDWLNLYKLLKNEILPNK